MSKKNNTSEVQKTTSAIIEKEKHFIKYVFWGLFVVIIIISIMALIKIRRLQEENIKEQVMYENKLDSLHTADMITMSKAFSWAVRSDLLRGNKDQAQLHLDNLLKEPHIKKAYIIDAEKNTVLLSTNNAEIGTPYADFTVINAKETTVNKSENTVRFATPIMDLNKKLGISVIEIETER
jgi:hypothetical protein